MRLATSVSRHFQGEHAAHLTQGVALG
jgi:hypothetical protein